MLAIATRNFVEEVDRGGLLIPVSNLNDTIALLTVVVKRKRFWFWQKPKYLPTDFTLNDLVTGDTPLQPVVVETDFIKYSGTFGDNIKETVGANLANTTVNLEGKDSSKLQSSFGSLKKEEINVQKLLRDSKDRMLDMSHSLIQQAKEKQRRVFGIVKERIVTTQPCSVIEEVQQEGQCGGVLGICGKKNPKIALKENGNLSTDSNVTMEIPIHTTIAYGLIELVVKHDGHFELCLMSDTDGGFEVDSSNKPRLVGVSGAPSHSSEQSSSLRQELEKLSDHFKLLSSLSVSIKSSLLKQITKLMQDQASISALQHVLDQICLEKLPDLDDATMTESARQNIKAILDLLEKSGQMGSTQAAGPSTSALTAIHLLTSALDEMTNDCFAVLGMCCSPTVLATLEQLVQCVLGNGELPLSSLGLAEDVYEKTEHLFASSKISLKRDGDVLKTEINHQPGNLPLILCIVIRSLASLAHGV